jgi:hypothetical protein
MFSACIELSVNDVNIKTTSKTTTIPRHFYEGIRAIKQLN